MKKKLSEQSAVAQIEFLKKRLGFVTYAKPPEVWLKTGSKMLNSVLGSRDRGVPYGKIITLAGKFSSGKTLLMLRLLGKAQQDGAIVALVDVENSFDPEHAKKQGLDPGEPVLNENGEVVGYSKLFLFRPEMGVFGKTGRQKAKERKKGKPKKVKVEDEVLEVQELDDNVRQQTAEELFELVKRWMVLQRQMNANCKLALGIDSTTGIQPEEELSAGLIDQNMRTRLSLANFLNQLTKDLVGLALNTNCLTILVSQLRTNPTKVFQNPDYVPGGNGVLFYPSSICWMRRIKNVRQKGKVVGLESVIVNKKNKMGAGSVENCECGIRSFYESQDWQFLPVEEILKKQKGE